jgi:glycoprotein endo-alpha-1,2-mannosidase
MYISILDGSWLHWNHDYIPPWDKNDNKVYPTGQHNPDVEDVGANFFPELGPYRSRSKLKIMAPN